MLFFFLLGSLIFNLFDQIIVEQLPFGCLIRLFDLLASTVFVGVTPCESAFADIGGALFVQVDYLVDQATLETGRDLRVFFVQWVVEDILSDEFGSSWHLTFGSRDQEVKDDFDLLHMICGVVFDLHELSDESHHTWEITFTVENLMDKQLFVALFRVISVVMRS